MLPPLARATSCSTQALRWLPPRSNGRLVSAYEIQRRRIRGGGHPDDSDSEPEELDGGDRFWVTIGSTFGLRGESVAVTDSEDEFTGDEGESKGADGTALGVVVEELAPEDPALPGNIQSPNNGVPEAAAVYVPAQRVVPCFMLCARAAVPTPNMRYTSALASPTLGQPKVLANQPDGSPAASASATHSGVSSVWGSSRRVPTQPLTAHSDSRAHSGRDRASSRASSRGRSASRDESPSGSRRSTGTLFSSLFGIRKSSRQGLQASASAPHLVASGTPTPRSASSSRFSSFTNLFRRSKGKVEPATGTILEAADDKTAAWSSPKSPPPVVAVVAGATSPECTPPPLPHPAASSSPGAGGGVGTPGRDAAALVREGRSLGVPAAESAARMAAHDQPVRMGDVGRFWCVRGLRPGTRHEYRIRAKNQIGFGEWGNASRICRTDRTFASASPFLHRV